MECAPAFNYARDAHTTRIVPDASVVGAQSKVVFASPALTLDLRYVSEVTLAPDEDPHGHCAPPEVKLELLDLSGKGHLGLAACAELSLLEGQAVTFVLRTPPDDSCETKEEAIDASAKERAAELGVPLESRSCGALARS